MVDGKKLINISLILIGIFFYNCLSIAMEKPYHHLPDGTFRNPEGSPKRDPNVKWSYKKTKEHEAMEKRLLKFIDTDWNV